MNRAQLLKKIEEIGLINYDMDDVEIAGQAVNDYLDSLCFNSELTESDLIALLIHFALESK